MVGKLFGIAAAMVLTSSVASAQVVGIGTTKGTAVDQMVAAIAKTVSTHSGIQMRSQAAGGSQRYIELVNAGQLEFGVANAMQTSMAVQGTGISEGRKYDNLRLVGTLMAFRNGLVVANDSDIKTLADLKGKRLPYDFKAAPLFSYFIDAVLANGGMSIDDAQKVPVVALAPSWELFKQGRVDGVITAAGAGATAEIDSRVPGGIRYLDLNAEGPGAEKTKDILPGIYFVKVSPDPKLPGIRSDVTIFGYDFLLWAHKDVKDDIVMKVAKALHDHADEIKASGALWRTYEAKNLAKDQGKNLQYHPGAIAYYKEAGIWNR